MSGKRFASRYIRVQLRLWAAWASGWRFESSRPHHAVRCEPAFPGL
jgi:hypothetical protein